MYHCVVKSSVCTAVACSKVHFECTWYWVTHAYLPDFLALQSLHQFLYPLLKSFSKVVRISKHLIGTYSIIHTIFPCHVFQSNVWFIKIRTIHKNKLSISLDRIIVLAPSIAPFKGLGMRNLQYWIRICQKTHYTVTNHN